MVNSSVLTACDMVHPMGTIFFENAILSAQGAIFLIPCHSKKDMLSIL